MAEKSVRKKAVFLTGATGLLGSYLLKILLENGHKVFCLARSKNNKSAKERIREVLKFWDEKVLTKNFNNLVVIQGDIVEEDLGIDEKTKHLLKNEIEEIFHFAALIKFNPPLEESRKVNVEGTRNILEFALEWDKEGKLSKINYASTIYICGDYKGVFKEDDLDVRQKFNTTYQQSKFEAELVVEEYRKKGLWIDVFRPPSVVGESITGKMLAFNRAFYQALHIWKQELFDYYPGANNYSLDIVCVDELCKSIFNISDKSSSRNKNYHPFPEQSLLLDRIISFSSECLEFKKPKLISTEEFLQCNLSPSELKLMQYNFFFLNESVKLDSKMTNEILKKYGFEFSNFYEGPFSKLLDYAVEARFIKMK